MTAAAAGAHVNAHTHLYSGLVPLGMPAPHPPPRDFVEILQRVWWRLDRAIDADTLRASARLYVAEAIEHGTFALVDHHESPHFIEGSLDVIADACDELGMRAVLCYGATERNGGREEAQRGLEECRRFIRDNRRPGVRGVVGLHACFTVGDETLRDAVAVARELSTVLHLHVAEDAVDVTDARERGYDGVIDRLDRLGAMIPGSIFAHGVHLTADEVARCARRGVWLVQNPRSNAANGVGYPNAARHSDRVALGTDGFPADMAAENDALAEAAKAAGDDLGKARARLAAGYALLAERLGDDASIGPEEQREARRRTGAALAEIRGEAHDQAQRLWARMRAL